MRLAGCNLRCTWCDSVFTFTGGEHRAIDDVVAEVDRAGIPLVEVTGGEPLVHRQAISLLQRLVDRGYTVLLETSGSRDVAAVPAAVHIIMDLKPPASGESGANRFENLALLRAKDEVKFVIADRGDYEWSREVVRVHGIDARCTVLFSPVHGSVDPAALATWIVEDRLPVRFQLQLHKQLWPPDRRGV